MMTDAPDFRGISCLMFVQFWLISGVQKGVVQINSVD
jgi:hypothetical protein